LPVEFFYQHHQGNLGIRQIVLVVVVLVLLFLLYLMHPELMYQLVLPAYMHQSVHLLNQISFGVEFLHQSLHESFRQQSLLSQLL